MPLYRLEQLFFQLFRIVVSESLLLDLSLLFLIPDYVFTIFNEIKQYLHFGFRQAFLLFDQISDRCLLLLVLYVLF